MSKIKLIIFDLDGVLVEAKNIHYEALNEALGKDYAISWNEHLSTYDGLKTFQKLEMLSKEKDLPVDSHQAVWELKQKLTQVAEGVVRCYPILLRAHPQKLQN